VLNSKEKGRGLRIVVIIMSNNKPFTDEHRQKLFEFHKGKKGS